MSEGFATHDDLDELRSHAGSERAELRQRVAELEATVEQLQERLRLVEAESRTDDAPVRDPATGD